MSPKAHHDDPQPDPGLSLGEVREPCATAAALRSRVRVLFEGPLNSPKELDLSACRGPSITPGSLPQTLLESVNFPLLRYEAARSLTRLANGEPKDPETYEFLRESRKVLNVVRQWVKILYGKTYVPEPLSDAVRALGAVNDGCLHGNLKTAQRGFQQFIDCSEALEGTPLQRPEEPHLQERLYRGALRAGRRIDAFNHTAKKKITLHDLHEFRKGFRFTLGIWQILVLVDPSPLSLEGFSAAFKANRALGKVRERCLEKAGIDVSSAKERDEKRITLRLPREVRASLTACGEALSRLVQDGELNCSTDSL